MTTDHRAGGRRGLLGAAAAALLATAAAPITVASAASTHPGARHQAAASEADNGRTLSLHRGERLTLTLHSTYWSVDGSSAPAVLREIATPMAHPAPSHCVPGQGCGTVTATFQAMRRGRADLTAHRTTCGEALQCAPTQRDLVVHVVVTG